MAGQLTWELIQAKNRVSDAKEKLGALPSSDSYLAILSDVVNSVAHLVAVAESLAESALSQR
jgi:hypothetical protein